MSAQWHIAINGQQQGPMTQAQLQGMINARRVPPGSLIWRDGMAGWQPFESVPEFARAGGPPAMPPGRAPQYPRHAPNPSQPYGTERTNSNPNHGKIPGIVIAGFILVFLCTIVGIILCAVGLGEAKRREAGVGLAWAGIIIGIVWIVLGIILQVVIHSM